MLARTTALGEYAVNHADTLTAENLPLALVLVQHAAVTPPSYSEEDISDIPESLRPFWESFRRDNLSLIDGQIVGIATSSALGSRAGVVISPIERSSGQQRLRGEPTMSASGPTRVFIAHGRDDGAKFEIAYFLRNIGVKPVILHERPNGGRTLISKFQEESADVKFAVVLLTPDDVGGLKGEEQRPRARQNVIFELGFFIGKLGAHNVCALLSDEIEKPSDFDAVVWIKYGPTTSWRLDLAKELRAAGIEFDQNAIFS